MTKAALLVLLCASGSFAQAPQHVAWTLTPEPGKPLIRAAGRIESGWHLYSGTSPAGIPTSFQLGPESIVSGVRVFQPPPKRAFDPNFGSDTETYEGDVTFLLVPTLKSAASQPLTVKIRYQTCNETQCVPSRFEGTVALSPETVASAVPEIPSGYAEVKGLSPGQPQTQNQALGAYLLVAFGFGLASIFTPCVFPMIPITMSYFLNRKSGLVDAVVFCLGIIVLFSGLGLATAALLGAGGVVQLGANPWVNAFISGLFILFGLSLLGAFEITIPSAILTRLNKSSEKAGFVGTLLMGLTFSLASFACVGPFVGTLLAASVQTGGARPLAGMVTFAAGLALPFFLLALFPAYLKKLPRSGGWMARVKVVMGFIILAASLKYLASLDAVLQWGFLTRERFLAAWIVLFGVAGLYLLGFVRLEGIKPEDRMGIGRLLAGMALLVFAISLAPGMTGGRLGDLDAFVPVATSNPGASSDGGASSEGGLVWLKNQYREALAKARAEGKLVFVNFTGYACANCHWMKANMFTRPEIAVELKSMVLVELYGDGTDAASEENQKLELAMFQTVAEPFYVIMDPDERVIATSGMTRDPAEFLAFLQKRNTQKPAAAPEVSSGIPRAKTIDGAELDPKTFEGKVVVVNFWATWCVPCIQEIPGFNKLYKENAGKGVAFLGISMDEEGAGKVKPFLQKHPIDYTVGLGSDAISTAYSLDELPVTLVFDRTGKQVKRITGFASEQELANALKLAL